MLTLELVPATAWWSNVRSNVSRAEWEICKAYSYTKRVNGGCIVCGGKGSRHATEAHEIWAYDDDNQIQTLVDIVPLCPTCHQVKHLGRTRAVSSRAEWERVIAHLQRVNNWQDHQVVQSVELAFAIWEARSQMEWGLDISFLTRLGISLENRVLERQS